MTVNVFMLNVSKSYFKIFQLKYAIKKIKINKLSITRLLLFLKKKITN